MGKTCIHRRTLDVIICKNSRESWNQKLIIKAMGKNHNDQDPIEDSINSDKVHDEYKIEEIENNEELICIAESLPGTNSVFQEEIVDSICNNMEKRKTSGVDLVPQDRI